MRQFKIIKVVVFTVLVSISYSANAQFWKKLKERTKDAVERTIINKTAQKAAQKAGEGVDKIFNVDFGDGSNGMGMVDPATLPPGYIFNWKYSLQMESDNGEIVFHYYLNEEEAYFGSQPEMKGNPMANNFMIFDVVNDVLVILSDYKSKKTGSALRLNLDNMIAKGNESQEELYEGYTYTKLGTKEILGYQCQGFKIESDEYIITSYMALDAPVSFTNMAQGMPKNLPKGFDPELLKSVEKSLMMEMQIEHKKKDKRNMTMKCIALEEIEENIQLSEYDFTYQEEAKKLE